MLPNILYILVDGLRADQCFGKDTLKACDDLWMTRYVLHQISEDYEVSINGTDVIKKDKSKKIAS